MCDYKKLNGGIVMNKKGIEKKTLTLVEKALKYGVSKEGMRWPPYCTTILHQPKRPMMKNSKNSDI